MPYFITDQQGDCDGWATVKEEDGALLTIGCHAAKQDAVDHMIAVSLAEDMDPGGERDLSAPAAIVVDIDDTLIALNGDPIENVVAFVKEYTGAVLIVTARREARRDETIAQLDAIGVDYELLQMRSDRTPEVAYKAAVVKNLFANWNIELAIENNANVRAEYARIGITVLAPSGVDPQELPQMLKRAPAPPKDQITGSDANDPGSASGAGGDVKLGATTEKALRNKVSEHNDAMDAADRPAYTRTTFGQLAAVYRRGSGAYSSSHRPGISRAAWSMGRVNAFLYLLRTGAPENKNYVTDNDLLPAGHPKSTRTIDARQVDLSMPEYIIEAAARGLEYHAAGLSGDGVVERTIREARLMADGQVSEDKVVRASAWAARHLVDLEAEDNRDPDAEGFPGAGAVAFYLWGIDPLDPQPAMEWFARKSEQIQAEERSAFVVGEPRGANIDPMTTSVETRRITVNEFELRDLGEGDGMAFTGYAAVFNSESEPLPFIERIAPGAFANSLSSRNEIKMFVNHDTTRVLASKRAGTLRLSEDAHGLRVEADLPPTTDGKDLAILMRRGDVDSMSFGFSVPSGGDTWSPDGATRELREVRLHEVSIVTAFPAYTATTAGVRSLDNLAAATGADVSELDAAITKLEAGEILDDDAAMLIESVVQKLRADTTIGAEVQASLDMKRKQLDLLFSRV